MNPPRVLVTGGTGMLGRRAFCEGALVCPDQAYGKIR
jgi:hypothetical protein